MALGLAESGRICDQKITVWSIAGATDRMVLKGGSTTINSERNKSTDVSTISIEEFYPKASGSQSI
jgi:hypothetical protein